MSDFPNSTPKIDEIVGSTMGPEGIEAMRQALKHELAGTVEQAVPVARPVQAANQSRPTHLRVVYPHLNDKCELYGSSEAELDEKERRLREMYGSQR